MPPVTLTVGVALFTLIFASADDGLKFALSVGAKATCRVWFWPALSTVPAAGVYVNVPATGLFLNVAVALSCVPLSAVP